MTMTDLESLALSLTEALDGSMLAEAGDHDVAIHNAMGIVAHVRITDTGLDHDVSIMLSVADAEAIEGAIYTCNTKGY